MLWAVPAKSPVAPRALAVLAFFLLLTLYLTWPLPLRMGSGLSTNPDSLLNFWAMAWSYHILVPSIYSSVYSSARTNLISLRSAGRPVPKLSPSEITDKS